MRKIKFIAVFQLFALLITSCLNEQEPQFSYKESNLKLLQTMAKDANIEVEIEIYKDKELNQSEILAHKLIFENIARLDNYAFKLIPNKCSSRVYEPYAYYGSASYDGNDFSVTVYWKKDNQTGDIIDVYGGLGGRFTTKYDDIYGSPTITGAVYSMIHYGQTINFMNNSTISLTLKADYVIETYTLNSAGYPDTSKLPLSRITSKVSASGDVNIINMTGAFDIHSAGEGSWGKDNLEI